MKQTKQESYFEQNKFEIWAKEEMKIGSIGILKDMEFKVLDCHYLIQQEVYAVLCLWLKKIAMLTPTFYHYSGIDRLTEQRASEATKIGHNVTVFCFEGDIK